METTEECSKKTQPARGWNAAEICTNCVYIIPAQSWVPDSVFGASRPSLPASWLALIFTKAGDVESNPGPTTHTNNTLQSFGFVTSVTNKETSLRCNHTHNTHWVNLKSTQIKQRQYKPNWRCTIHTPIQNVTTTPSTAHHKQTTTHLLTNNNQPKDKNIVILQININNIRNKTEELKTSYTAPNRTSSQYKK